MKDAFKDSSALNAYFLVDDPVFNLFVEAITTFPDSFVPVTSHVRIFSSLPLVEFQDAAGLGSFKKNEID